MAKKTKKKEAQEPPKPMPDAGISKRGRKVIAAGVGVIALGFAVLTQTDPRGQNWASVLSPFLILGGYGLVAGGIMLPDPQAVPASASTSAPLSPR